MLKLKKDIFKDYERKQSLKHFSLYVEFCSILGFFKLLFIQIVIFSVE